MSKTVSVDDEDYTVGEHGVVMVAVQQILRILNKKATKTGFSMFLTTDDERLKYFVVLEVAGKKEEFGPMTLDEGNQVVGSFENIVNSQKKQRSRS